MKLEFVRSRFVFLFSVFPLPCARCLSWLKAFEVPGPGLNPPPLTSPLPSPAAAKAGRSPTKASSTLNRFRQYLAGRYAVIGIKHLF